MLLEAGPAGIEARYLRWVGCSFQYFQNEPLLHTLHVDPQTSAYVTVRQGLGYNLRPECLKLLLEFLKYKHNDYYKQSAYICQIYYGSTDLSRPQAGI